MTATAPTQHSSPKAWVQAISTPANEFSLTPLPIRSGHLPPLQGSLYRNGPGRFNRNGVQIGHWFDGDGGVLAVHFDGHSAQGTYRLVQTAGYQAEETANNYLFSGYGSFPPGGLFQRLRAQLKNVANASILPLQDRLLALWEGGFPHCLDCHTLETYGTDDLEQLLPNETFSAHPKRHLHTGDIFNFGIIPGANATLNLYRSRANGVIEQKHSLPLNGIPLIHDFALADRYLVFCVPPVRLNALPAVLGLSSFSDALIWQPRFGTQILILEADSFEVAAWEQVDPWFQWHFGQAYLDLGEIIVEGVAYPDFATNQHLKEVASGRIQTQAHSQLWRLRIDPHSGRLRERQVLLPQSCEFPVAAAAADLVMAPTYLNIYRPEVEVAGELWGAIARFDPVSGHVSIADAGENRYPTEPIWVQDHTDPKQSWVLTVVYDGNIHASEVWIYDGAALEQGPLCRLGLPEVIPPSFHGAWQPRP